MSGPKSWGVSILLGLAGAALGWVIFTWALGIGDEDIFDWGGILSAIIGVLILPLIDGSSSNPGRQGADRAAARRHATTCGTLSHRRTRNRSLSSLEAQAGANLPDHVLRARRRPVRTNGLQPLRPQRPAPAAGLARPLAHFGGDRPFGDEPGNHPTSVRLGITHFDLANNYGPPAPPRRRSVACCDVTRLPTATSWSPRRRPATTCGRARTGVGLAQVPPGQPRSEPQRLGLDYVDIFYSHRFDPETPLEETMGARQRRPAGQGALRRHLLLLRPRDGQGSRDPAQPGDALIFTSPSYSLLNRWIEDELLDVLADEGIGCICFSPLAQGMLTDKYLDGIPRARARAARARSRPTCSLRDAGQDRALNDIAAERGQSLAQMALAWTLRDPRVTSTLVGRAASPSSR